MTDEPIKPWMICTEHLASGRGAICMRPAVRRVASRPLCARHATLAEKRAAKAAEWEAWLAADRLERSPAGSTPPSSSS